MTGKAMVVAGVMSGTSADGIDVALVRIGDALTRQSSDKTRQPGSQRERATRIDLLGHAKSQYPAKVRSAILSAMNAERARVADLARLNFLLGELYAEAVLCAQKQFRIKAQLIGCHGQTLYHQGQKQLFLGRETTATWQMGEAAVIAARVNVPVVSDFRPADMAAGGKGAPLVPYLDYLLFAHPKVGRIVQNIGGIANLTAIPAGAGPGQIFAFDTGPGNMIIDAVTWSLFKKPFDRDGKIAAAGIVLKPVVERLLRSRFFRAKPPKTAGREEFGREFVREFLELCHGFRKEDIVATATALTARSIADALRRFVIPKAGSKNTYDEMILSGGGGRNARLVAMLKQALRPLEIQLRFSDDFGLPGDAKEAVAFAVLAFETWNQRQSNVPSATGAKRPAVLGKISYA